jgi:hypothetical protein
MIYQAEHTPAIAHTSQQPINGSRDLAKRTLDHYLHDLRLAQR